MAFYSRAIRKFISLASWGQLQHSTCLNLYHYLVIQEAEVKVKGGRRKEGDHVIQQEDEMLSQKTAVTALNAVTVVTND